jgi:hypothetical protein
VTRTRRAHRVLAPVVAVALASTACLPRTLAAQLTMIAGARPTDEKLRLVLRDHAARGLPVAPLSAKLAEGRAKGAPDERIVAAVTLLAARLDTAARALGPTVTDGELREGAEALGAGATPGMLSRLKSRAKERSIEPPLVVLTRLLRRGVARADAERAVARLVDQRMAPAALMATADAILRDVEAGRGLGESLDTRLAPAGRTLGAEAAAVIDADGGMNIPFPGLLNGAGTTGRGPVKRP